MRPIRIDVDRDYPLRGYPGQTCGTTFAFLCVPVCHAHVMPMYTYVYAGMMLAYLCIHED